jgi:methylphosphotriester-DNA--protein-cysteine methyltransferase
VDLLDEPAASRRDQGDLPDVPSFVEQLLRRPELSLCDIARKAGFSDVPALRRAVHRWRGVTPPRLRGETAEQ